MSVYFYTFNIIGKSKQVGFSQNSFAALMDTFFTRKGNVSTVYTSIMTRTFDTEKKEMLIPYIPVYKV